MKNKMEVGIVLVLAGIYTVLATGCGSILPKGVELNAGFIAVDEGQTTRISNKKSNPWACAWNEKYCLADAKEAQGS